MAKQTAKKKGSKAWLILCVLIIAMATFIGITLWRQFKESNEARFVHYDAFGIDMPVNYEIHGIDVSKYQGIIYWPSVVKMKVNDIKLGFVFIKATEGLGKVDAGFRRNWIKAKEAGITRGAYHFFLATKSGKAQAQNFINTVDLQPGDLPPVLDIEQLYNVPPEKMRAEIKAFLQMLEDAYKVKPIIYTYVSFYNKYLGDEFDDYPLWIAHYFEKDKPRIDKSWRFWQHSELGKVDGITHRVDFNVFKGDSTDFKNLLLK
ncbi:glycoside hydrolase family 25 protein [Danxiaibacter flavus]|uniref:Glycoside hydrolase family 25 protein n=1 Tax=Danxiaibacter flavus TaxID=3049108 RepID=A0ABV3ZPG5_9BACT|nr:glycoside hydrolase family 25 protein [Chitinophagaceae bacterium DXS]